MKERAIGFKVVFTFTIIVLVGLCLNASADKKDEAFVAGKIYDADGIKPMAGVTVRIVNLETQGQREETTGEDGCYRFKGVENGSFSVVVVHKDQNYKYDGNIKVDRLEEVKVAVAQCFRMNPDNTLTLLDDCHICRKWIPRLASIL